MFIRLLLANLLAHDMLTLCGLTKYHLVSLTYFLVNVIDVALWQKPQLELSSQIRELLYLIFIELCFFFSYEIVPDLYHKFCESIVALNAENNRNQRLVHRHGQPNARFQVECDRADDFQRKYQASKKKDNRVYRSSRRVVINDKVELESKIFSPEDIETTFAPPWLLDLTYADAGPLINSLSTHEARKSGDVNVRANQTEFRRKLNSIKRKWVSERKNEELKEFLLEAFRDGHVVQTKPELTEMLSHHKFEEHPLIKIGNFPPEAFDERTVKHKVLPPLLRREPGVIKTIISTCISKHSQLTLQKIKSMLKSMIQNRTHDYIRENFSSKMWVYPKSGIEEVDYTRLTWSLPWIPYYRDWETDRKSTRLNSTHSAKSRMPSSA